MLSTTGADDRGTRRAAVAILAAALLVAACQLATPTASPTSAPSPTASSSTSPSPSASPGASATPSGGPSASPSSSPVEFLSYTVVRGDTLYAIGRAHATTWQSLVYWNRDRYASLDPDDPSYDPGRIEVGWVLLIQPEVVVPYEPGATPRPSAEPTASAPPSVAVRNGSRTSDAVALTFDMGGRVTPAVDIMEWLIANNVPATIFMTGAIIDSTNTDAGRTVLSLVDRHRGLFELGNHSYTHRDFRTLEVGQIAVELQGMEQAVATRSTLDPRPFFRPPYGGYDARVLAAVGGAGYSRTILWDVDSIDWRPESDGGPTTAQIVSKVRDNARGGSIILFHLGGYNTLDALPGVLDALADNGLRPAALSEVLGL